MRFWRLLRTCARWLAQEAKPTAPTPTPKRSLAYGDVLGADILCGIALDIRLGDYTEFVGGDEESRGHAMLRQIATRGGASSNLGEEIVTVSPKAI